VKRAYSPKTAPAPTAVERRVRSVLQEGITFSTGHPVITYQLKNHQPKH
jgi:hypothetical protein